MWQSLHLQFSEVSRVILLWKSRPSATVEKEVSVGIQIHAGWPGRRVSNSPLVQSVEDREYIMILANPPESRCP